MTKLQAMDTHIHLDMYSESAVEAIMNDAAKDGIAAVVAVSMGLESCERTLALARRYPDGVRPAFGFHPEQPIPAADEIDLLFRWLEEHREEVRAIGEVGLPYFSRTESEAKGVPFDVKPYAALLERFVELAARWDVPVALHAVQEDAPIVCDLLEKYGVRRAHFHWFKGDEQTIARMIANGYYVSVTPECLYDAETQAIISRYPLKLLLTETDGPWPFDGPYEGRETHPRMVHDIVRCIARMKGIPQEEAYRCLLSNAKKVYC